MEAFLVSIFTVTLAEMGDRTQLLSLSCPNRRPTERPMSWVSRPGHRSRERIEVVIGRTDVDVVDVKQEETARSRAYLRQETPLRHFGVGKAHVARRVFE